MTRTLIVILTWNRWKQYTKQTLESLYKWNEHVPDILFVDNASTDKTVRSLRKRGYEVLENEKNEGIFVGTRRGWLEAEKRGYDFILNLQNDFPCIAPIPFDDIYKLFDEQEDVGFVRLNYKKKKPGRDRNKLTGEKLEYEPWIKVGKTEFSKHNHQFSFNPNIFRASHATHLAKKVSDNPREWNIVERFHSLKLKAVKIKDPCPCFKTYIRPRVDDWKH